MTPTQCAAFCDVRGLTVFGVENGNECWCDSTSPDSTLEAAEGDCTALCTGDDTLLCGGFWRLTVYKKRELEVQQVEGWEYSNCYVDADARLLPVGKGASAQMTPLMCAQQCCGYRLFGVENGEECWCGDSLDTSKQTRAGECSTPCTGDGDVQCGGNWRINVYAD
ncbi:WSC-domain-containing protein, partial [Parathielavia appendiculata]